MISYSSGKVRGQGFVRVHTLANLRSALDLFLTRRFQMSLGTRGLRRAATTAASSRRGFASPDACVAYLQGECGIDTSFAEGFQRDGCAVVKGFATAEECDGMMARMSTLIDAWDPMELVVFRTDSKQVDAQAQSDYFLNSEMG